MNDYLVMCYFEEEPTLYTSYNPAACFVTCLVYFFLNYDTSDPNDQAELILQ